MRLDQMTARPRAMLSMARVVMKDGTRKRSEIQPFHQPMSNPSVRMMGMAAYAGTRSRISR